MIFKIIASIFLITGLVSAQNFTTISLNTTSIATITSCSGNTCASSTAAPSLTTITITEQNTVTEYSTFCPSQISTGSIMSASAESSIYPSTSSTNVSMSSTFEGGASKQGLPAALAIIGAAVLL